MAKLVFETVVHTVLFPGAVMVGFPYLLLSSGLEICPFTSTPLRLLGLLLVGVGTAIGAWCTRDFIVSGRGTPNPLDPPKFLVRAGPYRHVRNPMYVCVGCILAGEAFVVGSTTLLIYLVVVILGFHLVVVFYEEPTLRRLFGPAYDDYCTRVPRWFPHVARRRPGRAT